MALLGPLFREELKRLNRRSSVFFLRVALAGVLLAAIALQHPGDGVTVGLKRQAELARSVFQGVVAAQFAAVWFLTPLFAAAVLTEEREKKTLDLLLATPLSSHELVAGKMVARLVYVAGVLLAGLPIMAMLRVFGGIEFRELGLAYTALLVNLWAVGGVAVGSAAVQRTYRAALYSTWIVLAFCCFPLALGPFDVLSAMNRTESVEWQWVVAWAVPNVILGFIGLTVATHSTRDSVAQRAGDTNGRTDTRSAPARLVAEIKPPEPIPARGVSPDIEWSHPPDPVEGPTTRQLVSGCLFATCGLGLLIGLAAHDSRKPNREWLTYLALAWVPAGVAIAVQTAGVVSRELEADTLTTLLTVPPTRTEILWRKFTRTARKNVALGAFTGILAASFFLLSGEWSWYPGFLVLGFGMVAASASLGLLMTVLCRTTFLAQVAAVLCVLFLGVLPGWTSTVFPGHRAAWFVPVHFVFLVFVAAAGWWFSAAVFRGYAKK